MGKVSLESLPLGFRFRPTDEELINHYLRHMINGRHADVHVIPEIDVCKWEPWDLPSLSMIKTDDPEWFFFCPRDRKYPNGQRSNRATVAGYWKATGKDRTIRSRAYRSASNPNGLIGMKKTLVFYRGRAPKGERTYWVMHEYRPTLKDLDGTGPGQDPFVLCRLFRKPEEKTDASKEDEVNQTGSPPTTTKSSPDDTSSDIIQETETSNMPVEGDECEVMKVGPVESGSASYMASDVEDQGTPLGVRMKLEDQLKTNDHAYDHLDFADCSPLHSQIDLVPTAYVGSPFAFEFGNDINGFQFQDGTGEQDLSLTEILDEALINHDESSCEESTYQENPVGGRKDHLSGQTQLLQNIMPVSSYNGSYTDTYNNTAQHDLDMRFSGFFNEQMDFKDMMLMQAQSGNLHAEAPWSNQQLRTGNTSQPGESIVGQVSFPGDYAPIYDSYREPNGENVPINYYGTGGGTGIKIRTRQAQRPASNNTEVQGDASRRIRLQTSMSPGLVTNDNMRDSNQVSEVTEQGSTLDEQEREYSGSHPGVGPRIKIRARSTTQLARGGNVPQSTTNGNGEDVNENKTEGEDESQSTEDVSSDGDAKDINQTTEDDDDFDDDDDEDELESIVTEDSLEDEDEDEVLSPLTQASEATKKSQFLDEEENERASVKRDISKELTDEGGEIVEESTAGGPKCKTSEISSPGPRLRAKKEDVTRADQSIEPLESLKTLPRHQGPISSITSFGVCTVIVVFLGSFGLWRALDLLIA